MRGYESAACNARVDVILGYESPCGVMRQRRAEPTRDANPLRIPMRGYESG